MLIKNVQKGWSTATNFIDRDDNFVGYDDSCQCCEQFGWFFSDVPGVDKGWVDTVSTGFFWDTATPPVHPSTLETEYTYDKHASCVAFKAINDAGDVLYLTLFNEHNGYYSHGWEAPFLNGSGAL